MYELFIFETSCHSIIQADLKLVHLPASPSLVMGECTLKGCTLSSSSAELDSLKESTTEFWSRSFVPINRKYLL